MTLLIGHKDGWLVGDKRANYDNEKWPLSVTKVHELSARTINGTEVHALFGSAGECKVRNRLAEAVKCKETVKQVIDFCIEGSPECHILVVEKGRLRIFFGDGAWEEITKDWWTIGTGSHVAYGYLVACEQLNPEFCKIDHTQAYLAIETASDRLNSVSREAFGLKL